LLWRTYVCRNGFRPFLTDEGGSGEPLSWEDIPLLKYECEIFVKTGAWKSIEDLEYNLTLDEMFLLYRACANDTNTTMKVMAASQGADVDFDDDWYDPEPVRPADAKEISSIPFGLGYSIE
jgi:hypothetical protein